ncbi:hypothetical protein [uncultured Litoreibacter sp.]|uniref:hypothetical protein n=1 Tax=uncultured Litoreibacter sp. TaxID=1392394 RepID=UPI00260FD9E3|nr:hypothetical protein [uncultured Litoreibacter sp.]
MIFAAGQVWSFAETEDHPQLIVTIGCIDTAGDLGADPSNCAVLSVSMTPSEEARKLDWPQVEHAPIAETAFNSDNTAELVLDGVSSPEGFREGYTTWRTAFDAGNAGVFSLAPPDAYAAILQVYAEKG